MGCHQGQARRHERGFTLLEMMIAVAVIAVLAIIAVPAFFKEGRKVKADTEVNAMFAELTTRLEQWKVDNGTYRDAAACPATPSATGVASTTCTGAGSDWELLRVNPPESTLRCSYQVVSGLPGDAATIPVGFTWTAPVSMSWYFVVATCDMDQSAAKNATFFIASTDARIQKQHEGH